MVKPGYMPNSSLQQLVGYELPTMRAAKPTARMWRRLRRERHRAKRDLNIGVATPGGAVRMMADLIDIQAQWLGKSHRIDWHLNPGSGAMPSLTSVHGLGRCLDFTGDVFWVKQVAEEYGITFPLVYLGDTNHGQHDGKTRGAANLYPYELKRAARFLHCSGSTAATGKRDKPYLAALRAYAAKHDLSGRPRTVIENAILDREAGL